MSRLTVHRAVRATLTVLLAVAAVTPAALIPSSAAASRADEPVGGARLHGTGVVLDADKGAPHLPKVKAKAFVVADADTGDVLAAKAPHVAYRPASTLKILTALVTLPLLPPDTEYVARDQDARAEGTRVGLMPGHTYTADQLFQGMLIVSGNDAASAVANAAGGYRPTVEKMNALARHLQAYDTTAVNTSGLDAPGQFSSAYDMALLGRAALANKRLTTFATTIKATFPAKGKHKTFEIWSINRLLYNDDDAIGVKTGWTTKARGTYVGAATHGGRTLVASVLHTDDDSWRDAQALLDWGFAAADRVHPVGELVEPAPQGSADESAQVAAGTGGTKASASGAGKDTNSLWVSGPLVGLAALAAALVLLRVRAVSRRRRRRRRRTTAGSGAAGPVTRGRGATPRR